jgi:hypothetical protein
MDNRTKMLNECLKNEKMTENQCNHFVRGALKMYEAFINNQTCRWCGEKGADMQPIHDKCMESAAPLI